MLNEVHPETGLCLNSGWERKRAQEWAAEYERVNGIHCEQCTQPVEQREKSMPRNMWMAFKQNEQEFERAKKVYAKNPKMSSQKNLLCLG